MLLMVAKVIATSLALVHPGAMCNHVLLDIMSPGNMRVAVLEWFKALSFPLAYLH
jgi:hypothetical protein